MCGSKSMLGVGTFFVVCGVRPQKCGIFDGRQVHNAKETGAKKTDELWGEKEMEMMSWGVVALSVGQSASECNVSENKGQLHTLEVPTQKNHTGGDLCLLWRTALG